MTTDDSLFEIPTTLSPRLQWMQKYGILISDGGEDYEPEGKDEISGNRLYRYWAKAMFIPRYPESGGDTEDDAIVALAKKLNLKLWNE
jgi:hypothetical protein